MTRRSAVVLVLPLLALIAGAAPASARQYVPEVSYEPTPQWWAVELKFGPYRPDIDDEFGGSGPYRDIFGRKMKLMAQGTLDFQFLKLHGTLGVGGTVGILHARGAALSETGEETGDTTTLTLMPFVLQLVYRWDYMAKRWHIPLVPYVRAGIALGVWWITDGTGKIAYFDADRNDKAHGATWGYQINIGLALMLDDLEPGSAKKMDMELGINHTYLFCEFVHSRLDDFGSSDSMRLGMKYSLLAGITMEF